MKPFIAKPVAAWLVAAACVAAGSAATAQNRELGSTGVLLDGIAAVVDEGVVLKSELEAAVENFLFQEANAPPDQRRPLPARSVIEKEILERLIVREIQVQRAQRRGIEISDVELNEALAAIAEQNGFTLAELPAVLAANGVDYPAFREAQRKDLMVETLRRATLRNRVIPTDREVERCLAFTAVAQTDDFEYDISHILVGVPSAATSDEIAAARARAEDIVRRVEAGEVFAQIALTESDAQTSLEGGSLGWRKGLELPTMFAETVRRMEPGEISDPIQSTGGFQIVRLNEMRGAERLMTEQIEVRHILLRPTEIMDDAAVRQRLLGIREQIVSGAAEFGPMARSISDDVPTASEGGQFGWLSPSDYAAEFEEQVWDMPLDTVSEPFQTRFGWHIAEVTGRRVADLTDEMRETECQNQLMRGKIDEVDGLWERQLRDEAYVDIRL
jgi:peptidyl-prolyl cis-trans isomerase SurA